MPLQSAHQAPADEAPTEYIHLIPMQLAIFMRDGIYQARVYVDKKYVFRSLKTHEKGQATTAAYRLLGELENKVAHNLPIKSLSVAKALARRGAWFSRESF